MSNRNDKRQADGTKKRPGVEPLFKDSDALPPEIFTNASVANRQGGATIKPPGPTAKQADRARLRLIKKLNLVGDKTIVARMKRCRVHGRKAPAPCWQNLCPVCGRLLGRWIAWSAPVALRKVLKAGGHADDGAWWVDCAVLTITPPMRFDKAEFQSAPERIERVIDDLHSAS